jgi:hypothetical protein
VILRFHPGTQRNLSTAKSAKIIQASRFNKKRHEEKSLALSQPACVETVALYNGLCLFQ